MDFLKIFSLNPDEKDRYGTLFSRLDPIIGQLPEREVKYIAGFAGLLGRVANADNHISEDELRSISDVLRARAALPKEQIDSIVQILKEATVELSGIEDHRYVQLINDVTDKEGRMLVLECLLIVAAADESISDEEEAALRIISQGMFLTNTDYIDVRAKFKQYLDVLKNLPSS